MCSSDLILITILRICYGVLALLILLFLFFLCCWPCSNNRKYPLADYALTPTIAIVDPALVETVPAFIAADTGMDVLTHATEAYTSNFANDYTDGIALQTIKLVFKYLEKSVKTADPEAREKMHNASTMAGMAFANAFLGMSHSMAHKIGGVHHTIHGRTNAILLPYS